MTWTDSTQPEESKQSNESEGGAACCGGLLYFESSFVVVGGVVLECIRIGLESDLKIHAQKFFELDTVCEQVAKGTRNH